MAVRSSCWHANDSESQAMWRLYSETGNGIAIATTVRSLVEALQTTGVDEAFDIFRIIYADFDRMDYELSELKPAKARISICKKKAFEHERDVRLSIRPTPADPREWLKETFGTGSPTRLPIDIESLIHGVHISPYCKEPFPTSVSKVCDIYGINLNRVKQSTLLKAPDGRISRYL